MNFSNEWEEAYSTGRAGSEWPWSDLVTYVMRYAKPSKTPYRVLDLGCAVGANVPFFQKLGVEYYGIEGSTNAVERLRKIFPELSAHIAAGDFTEDIPFDTTFDLIVDRGSLTHNTTAAIQNCLGLLRKRLAPEGRFIGIDWFSTEHADFKKGTEAGDENTREDITDGQFKGIGRVHFADKQHLESLFKDFTLTKLEHKKIFEEIPNTGHVFASWNFVAQKKT